MQPKYALIVFLFFVTFLYSCSAQKNGYVVTNNNDTIRGKFKLSISPESAAYGAPKVFAISNSKNTKINIYTDSIKRIDIVKDKKITDSYITSDNDLWQLIAAKGNLGIYRRYYKIYTSAYVTDFENGNYGETQYYARGYEEIGLFSDNIKIEEFYNNVRNFALIHKETLQFINDRYKVKLTKWKDIKSQKKLFYFILNEEAELQNANVTKAN